MSVYKYESFPITQQIQGSLTKVEYTFKWSPQGFSDEPKTMPLPVQTNSAIFKSEYKLEGKMQSNDLLNKVDTITLPNSEQIEEKPNLSTYNLSEPKSNKKADNIDLPEGQKDTNLNKGNFNFDNSNQNNDTLNKGNFDFDLGQGTQKITEGNFDFDLGQGTQKITEGEFKFDLGQGTQKVTEGNFDFDLGQGTQKVTEGNFKFNLGQGTQKVTEGEFKFDLGQGTQDTKEGNYSLDIGQGTQDTSKGNYSLDLHPWDKYPDSSFTPDTFSKKNKVAQGISTDPTVGKPNFVGGTIGGDIGVGLNNVLNFPNLTNKDFQFKKDWLLPYNASAIVKLMPFRRFSSGRVTSREVRQNNLAFPNGSQTRKKFDLQKDSLAKDSLNAGQNRKPLNENELAFKDGNQKIENFGKKLSSSTSQNKLGGNNYKDYEDEISWSDIKFNSEGYVAPWPSKNFKVNNINALIFKAKSDNPFYVIYQDEDFVFDKAMISVVQSKNIITTKIVGKNGTIKEYIGLNDYEITIDAVLLSYMNGYYPIDKVTALRNYLQLIDTPIYVENDLLNNVYGIYYIVIKSYDLSMEEGSISQQKIKINAISDDFYTQDDVDLNPYGI